MESSYRLISDLKWFLGLIRRTQAMHFLWTKRYYLLLFTGFVKRNAHFWLSSYNDRPHGSE